MTIRRRDLLTGTALVLVGERLASAEVISGSLPWRPDAGAPPEAVTPGPPRPHHPAKLTTCVSAATEPAGSQFEPQQTFVVLLLEESFASCSPVWSRVNFTQVLSAVCGGAIGTAVSV